MLLFYCSRCIIILSLKNGWAIMRRKTIDTIPVLSDAMKNILSAFSKSRALPSGLVKRASIILLTSHGELNQTIAPQVGLHHNNVATWRSRFLAALPALRKIEMDAPESFARKGNKVCAACTRVPRKKAGKVHTLFAQMK